MRRAKHNLSHYRITAGDFGLLYPYSCTEVLPGDTFRSAASALVRIQPLMTPLMHPVDISVACWFVPNRLIWDQFEAFITGRNTQATVPTQVVNEADQITDYMGLPHSSNAANALPIRAYNLIWNEFYRDQDIQAERSEDTTTVANVAWSKDYFTTARPYAQAGADLGESARITFASDVPVSGIRAHPVSWNNTDLGDGTQGAWIGTVGDSTIGVDSNPQTPTQANVRIAAGTVGGNLDINEWRRAMALQRFREHRNKFGSRYKDMLAFLGVTSPDGRLDRPEYLGGSRQTIAFSEVLQTVEDSTNNIPLGAQGGHGIASLRSAPWKKMFLEHGYVISMLSIRPKGMYLSAADRTWFRSTKDDFWQKENEVLGEQPVLNREVHATHATPNGTFGYSPRHDEYRTQRSYAVGPMRRSEYNTWHMAREFAQDPALNDDFIKCEPTKRVFRSSNDPHFYAMVQNRVAARRLVRKHAMN